MTDQIRDASTLIAEIEAAGRSLYHIAKRMQLQWVQVQRIKDSGRCQPKQYEKLLAIWRESVSHETIQNVPISSDNSPETGA